MESSERNRNQDAGLLASLGGRVEREVLLAPDVVARTAGMAAAEPAQRWMLSQPRSIRRTYVNEVLDPRGGDIAQKRWMLRQPPGVRASYIEIVLAAGPDGPRPEVVWMLTQSDAVRASFVAEVLEADPAAPRPDVAWLLRQPDAVRLSYIHDVIADESA
jgi:hypothetical protein